MEYTVVFMQYLLDDFKAGKKTESLGEFVRLTYKQTLEKYHNFLVRQVFAVCSFISYWVRHVKF